MCAESDVREWEALDWGESESVGAQRLRTKLVVHWNLHLSTQPPTWISNYSIILILLLSSRLALTYKAPSSAFPLSQSLYSLLLARTYYYFVHLHSV